MVVENALRLRVALFKFVQEHCDKLIRDQSTRFGRPILRGIWGTIFAKMKRNRKAELNKDIISAKLKQVQQHIHDWPSSYKKRTIPMNQYPERLF